MRQGTFDPGAYKFRMGAVPDRARGSGHMVPTYTCRDHAGSTAQRLMRLCTSIRPANANKRFGGMTMCPSNGASDASVTEAKSRMREVAKSRRSAIAPEKRAAMSEALAHLDTAKVIGAPPMVVSAFKSMGEELDTGPLIARLSGAGYRICLPVMQGKGKPLVFRLWSPGDVLGKAIWGIEEPTPDKPALDPDVLLVPLLAFDRSGWRLGYGGGFFDRTLRGLRARKAVRAIGLGFASQEVDAVPHLDYDERLDAVLTPDGLIAFGNQSTAGDAASFSR